jgi:putative endonuclease
MEEHYYIYIIYSASKDRYYIGHTQYLEQRLIQHNAGRTPSTKYFRPWVLVYEEEFDNKSEASILELKIKSKKSRIYIEELIKKMVKPKASFWESVPMIIGKVPGSIPGLATRN